jgi:hypothetical protein
MYYTTAIAQDLSETEAIWYKEYCYIHWDMSLVCILILPVYNRNWLAEHITWG